MSTCFFSAPGRTEISGNHTDHQHGCVLAAAVNLETVAEVLVMDVFKFASYNPSRAVGFYDRGEIRKGLRADLVIVDHWMKVNKVILKGEVQ